MNPWYARATVLLAAGAIGLIRAAHSRRRQSVRTATRRVGPLEIVALMAAIFGFVVPLFWVGTSWFAFANVELRPVPLVAGSVVQAFSLWLFHRTHADLGLNWSARLELLESHQLVTAGVYRHIRHPMYLSLLLYGLGQALVVPNWIAGPCCLVGTALLFALRVTPEEAMLRERFGVAYDAWAARTTRLIPGVW